MKLLTEELRRRLPPLYSQENGKDTRPFTPSFSRRIRAGPGS